MIKFPKVVAAKLTKEEYDLCQEIAREYYISRYIRAPSNSELIRVALREFFERYLSNRAVKNRGEKEKKQETRQRRVARKPFDFINWDRVGRS